jgi:hypothetical protein
MSDTTAAQFEYWSAVCHRAREEAAFPATQPCAAGAIVHPVGVGGVTLRMVVNTQAHWVRSEIYLAGCSAPELFEHFANRRTSIEGRFGTPLDWEEKDGRQARRIASYLMNADPLDRGDWCRQHDWLIETSNRLHHAFSLAIKELSTEDRS